LARAKSGSHAFLSLRGCDMKSRPDGSYPHNHLSGRDQTDGEPGDGDPSGIVGAGLAQDTIGVLGVLSEFKFRKGSRLSPRQRVHATAALLESVRPCCSAAGLPVRVSAGPIACNMIPGICCT
jgi:hypothetical protein